MLESQDHFPEEEEGLLEEAFHNESHSQAAAAAAIVADEEAAQSMFGPHGFDSDRQGMESGSGLLAEGGEGN